mmetsp:Transcript_25776/g.56882  ORF Transcript_25776/g.56882 Transcript_25776/m.56882 type:complete len:273 (-) Transcript_25776:238-1056(-)
MRGPWRDAGSIGPGGGIGFFGALRSAAAGLVAPSDEELGNPYIDIADEEAFQEEFDRQAAPSPRTFFASALPSFFGAGEAQASAKAKPQSRFAGFVDGAPRSKRELLRAVTPKFLRSEEDADVASTCCPQLPFTQRLFGCACCVAVGQLLQFCGFSAATGVLIGHPGRFASMWTLGNLTMMAASFFFSGPTQQCRKIRAKGRLPTFAFLVTSMFCTLVVVYGQPFLGRALVILFLVAVQWMAQVWYILSFVPYGHTVGWRILRKLGRCCCDF